MPPEPCPRSRLPRPATRRRWRPYSMGDRRGRCAGSGRHWRGARGPRCSPPRSPPLSSDAALGAAGVRLVLAEGCFAAIPLAAVRERAWWATSALPSAGPAGARSTGGGDRVLKPLADPHRKRPTIVLREFGDRLIQLVADPQRDPMARSAGFSGAHTRSIGCPGQSVKNSLGYWEYH